MGKIKRAPKNKVNPPCDGSRSWQPNHEPDEWEKKFIEVIGTLDWKTFLDKKKYVNLCIYNRVAKWDDLAGEEAFRDSKKRFFEERIHGDDHPRGSLVMHGNPDLYIDKIDWDSGVDQTLVAELDKCVRLYHKVLKWDDSAAEEAFQNVQQRILEEKIYGHQRSDLMILSPDDPIDWDAEVDPELFDELDQVDRDSEIDPELLLDDLDEYGDSFLDTGKSIEPVVIFGDEFRSEKGFSNDGWGVGDLEDAVRDSNFNNDHPWEEKNQVQSQSTAKKDGWGDLITDNVGANNLDDGHIGPAGRTYNHQGTILNAKKNNINAASGRMRMPSYTASTFRGIKRTGGGYVWREGINHKTFACF
ncbi:OLC1v1001588C1 [Oldenlandia corymbosa var. corymbosa]|uniref:OLC1v1001588C1 n=1 Tax=Oldenlandia corymbosa var. corymbosa TaxID=529605 RepID=A0AAV1D5K4_OLDCO|nr:OLC1v1001588C1 [Oldenlandia corymbosa var. corymbosa]